MSQPLMLKLDDLKSRNRVFGVPPTVDELLNPSEEREMEDSPFDSQDPVSDDDDDGDDESASVTRSTERIMSAN